MQVRKNSLVLYKNSPAVIISIEEKISILLPGGKTRRVRDKDLYFLHPGPVTDLPRLEEEAPQGKPQEAWEILQGESPSLVDLAEFVYGKHTPTTAWLAFKLLNRSPWFKGKPDAITVQPPHAVAEEIRAEQKKAENEAHWDDFLLRFNEGKIDHKKDASFLEALENYALGRSKGSRLLKALGKIQNPENAHRCMLSKGVKEERWNPHPLRLNIPLSPPDYPLGELQDVERRHLFGTEAFAIDDEGNQDPDDAISWDGERLWVHVADVAGLIARNSPEDEAAQERASSLYLPECYVPMLPLEASSRLGLGIQETSPALSYSFLPDKDGTIVDFDIVLSQVRVTRISYNEADKRMGEEPFSSIKRFTDIFRAYREKNGSISIQIPEVKIRVNQEGEIILQELKESESRRMVSEAMLMAGYYAASWCHSKKIPIPFLLQEFSAAEKSPASDSALDFKKAPFVEDFSQRRRMKRSHTSLQFGPHAGLGLPKYTRVTSPLRRYPDLITSQQIRDFLLGEKTEDADAILQKLAACETRSGQLIQAERRSNLMWKHLWLKRHKGWEGKAFLIDRYERKGHFFIPEIALETRVKMKEDWALGTVVLLAIKEVDIAENTAYFTIIRVLK